MTPTDIEDGARDAVDEALEDQPARAHRRSPAQPRFCTPRNPARESLGHELVDVIVMLGFDPLPWQRQVADVVLELDADGDLVYREVVLVLPRRSGKTVLLLALRVWRALKGAQRWGARQHSAYVIGTAKYPFAMDLFKEEELPVLQASRVGRHVKPILTLNKEGLRWRNGSRHSILAATKNAGHSMGIDQVEIDEAFKVPDGRLEEGFGPAMLTRRSPQMWIVSAIGDLTDEATPSAWLWGKVEAGRMRCVAIEEALAAGRDAPVYASAYFEWSAPEDADPYDPEVWWSTHPAMGYTVDEKALRGELEVRSPRTFMRAYLCIWPAKRLHARIVPEDVWRSHAHFEPEPRSEAAQFVGPLVLAVDASSGLGSTSLVVAGRRADGDPQVEVVKRADGAVWAPVAIAKLVRAHRCSVVMSKQSPAAALLPELARVEIRDDAGEVEATVAVEVEQLSTEDVFRAAELWVLQFTAGSARHIGQSSLDVAVDVAVKRFFGQQRRFAFEPAEAGGDVSPLRAASLALWRALEPAPGSPRLRWI